MRLKSVKTINIFLIILFLQIALLICFGNRKEGFHNDEIYSHGLSNSYFKPFPEDCEQWLTPNYFNEYITVQENDKFNYESVFYNQSQDVHPPLYYLILNTVCSFFPNMFSKWFGIGINIIFFILTQIVLFNFSKKLLKCDLKALIVCFFWGTSVGAISSVIFIRMYTLLTFLFVLMDYVILDFFQNKKIKIYQLFAFYVVAFLGLFTQYYFVIFLFFTVCSVMLYFAINRRFSDVFKIGITSLLSILSLVLAFPSCLLHIFSGYRGTESIENLSHSNILRTLFLYLGIINNSLFGGNFVAILTALICIYVYTKNKKRLVQSQNNTSVSMFIIPSLLYVIFIAKISPYQDIRYILPTFPFLILGSVIFLFHSFSLKNNKKTTNILVSVFCVFICICGLAFPKVNYLFKGYSDVLRTSEKYQDKSCLFFSPNGSSSSECFLDLKNYSRVYMHTKKLEDLDPKIFSDLSDVIVYINDSMDKEDILNYIISNSNMSNRTKLFNSSIFSCYYLN